MKDPNHPYGEAVGGLVLVPKIPPSSLMAIPPAAAAPPTKRIINPMKMQSPLRLGSPNDSSSIVMLILIF
jgi:hypothetical protein